MVVDDEDDMVDVGREVEVVLVVVFPLFVELVVLLFLIKATQLPAL